MSVKHLTFNIIPSSTLSLKACGFELHIVREEGQLVENSPKINEMIFILWTHFIYSIFIIFNPKLSTISPILHVRKREGTYQVCSTNTG